MKISRRGLRRGQNKEVMNTGVDAAGAENHATKDGEEWFLKGKAKWKIVDYAKSIRS